MKLLKLNSNKVSRNVLLCIPGLVLLVIGIYLVIFEPHINFAMNTARETMELVEGKHGYNEWKTPKIYFKLFLFHVTNPNDIMKGATPILEERGPYVYDVKIEKRVHEVDEENDEIAFSIVKYYRFNKVLSGKNTPEDSIVMLNSPYVGIVNTLSVKAAMFLPKLGNQIQNLFPRTRDIFLRTKVKSFLFDGLPLVCDQEKFPDLGMVCSFLKMQKPPMLKDGDAEGTYTYSLFGALNGTEQGPFTVNRGIKDKESLGNLTSYKNLRVGKFWNDKSCNIVSGSDSATWPPMIEKLPYVTVFESTLCRSMNPVYKRDEILNGVMGHRYEIDESTWAEPNISCYCPLGPKKQLNCLPTGLLDISKCQDADAIYSEPHFLHGDPDLLDYAKGLTPDPQIHATYVLLDPLTGAPLSGSKKIQLNVRIKPLAAITMLSNVTEGICPFLWAEETSELSIVQLVPAINYHRLVRVMKYITWHPIILAIFYFLYLVIIQTAPENQLKTSQVQVAQNNHSPNQQLVKQASNRCNNAFS